MEPEDHIDPDERPARTCNEVDRLYALLLMHERTRNGWMEAGADRAELARKLAAVRTELIERERMERRRTHN